MGELDTPTRTLLAVGVSVLLGTILVALPNRALGRRDLVMAGYAAIVAVLGTYAFLGGIGALVAAAFVVGTFALGAIIYVLLGIASRWAERE